MKPFIQRRWTPLLLGALLVAITFAAYFGVWRNSFVELDDQYYVFANPWVKSGLTWSTVSWAFTHFHAQNWHPLTWLSHMLDVQMYGLNPGGHHVTSLVFHITNVVLLFVVLRRMTGSLWRSALVAALFGVHPLHVESVAWIAERKDVLSAFFFLLTLLFYSKYVMQRFGDPRKKHSEKQPMTGEKAGAQAKEDETPAQNILMGRFSYILALVFFALGLMSKPMLVTLPFVLLLLDWWPLGRFEQAGKKFTERLDVLAREKIPFFALSLVSSIITMQAQASAMPTMQQLTLGYRLQNALRSCWIYVQQTFWPENLTVFYPHGEISHAQIQMAGVALSIITLAALLYARRFKFFATGWFWYVGMLVPVLGIVQVGSQAHADRYTYLPHIGLFIIIAWGLGCVVQRFSALKLVIGPAMTALVVVLAMVCNSQVQFWRDSLTLFEHGARVNPKDYLARCILAKAQIEAGNTDEAIRELEQILRDAPKYPFAEFLMANALQNQGRMKEAIPHLLTITAPDYTTARDARLVLSYLQTGQLTEAQAAMDGLVQNNSMNRDVMVMQAAILRHAGNEQSAAELFQNVLSNLGLPTLADNPTMNFETAELYALIGKPREAVPFYSKAVELGPTNVEALNNFAWVLATSSDAEIRNGGKAVELAKKACDLSQWKIPVLIGTLAAAYAEDGKFEDAVKTAEKARDLARAQGQEETAKRNEELLLIYQRNQPYRE